MDHSTYGREAVFNHMLLLLSLPATPFLTLLFNDGEKYTTPYHGDANAENTGSFIYS